MKDKDIETAVNSMIIKEKKVSPKTSNRATTPKGRDGKYVTAKEPTDAAGWLRKAYVDADPADGAPKVGNMGYV